MEILKPDQLKEKFNDPWIAPYQKVLTMVDGDKVEIVEFHPCISGSHWLLYQYKNNSDLIDSAYRDGNKHVYSCHIGCAPLDLKASFNAVVCSASRICSTYFRSTFSLPIENESLPNCFIFT